MKKLFFILAAFFALTFIGCRQQDEGFSPEERENLQLLKQSRADSTAAAQSTTFNGQMLDGDPARPPIK